MSSYSFVPLITIPDTVTATTGTLIDNILTYNVECINNPDQGIFVADVTDHHTVVYIHRIPKDKEPEVCIITCIYSMKNKQAFLNLNQGKKKYHDRKTWLSEALRTAIKHKNKFYHGYSLTRKQPKYWGQTRYQDLFIRYKNDMKKSWGIINHLVDRDQVQSCQTKSNLEDGRIINDNFSISKYFNDFLTTLCLIWRNAFQKKRIC